MSVHASVMGCWKQCDCKSTKRLTNERCTLYTTANIHREKIIFFLGGVGEISLLCFQHPNGMAAKRLLPFRQKQRAPAKMCKIKRRQNKICTLIRNDPIGNTHGIKTFGFRMGFCWRIDVRTQTS